MSLREIKVLSSTRGGVKTVYSEATQWGQLKDSLSEFGDISKMSAVIKETKNTLSVDDALLPEGDFTLYLSPKQIKAGNTREVQILEDLKSAFNDAVDEIIAGIEEGDYDHLESARKGGKSSSEAIDDEDKAFLAGLKKF
jgi:hypothetical protein